MMMPSHKLRNLISRWLSQKARWKNIFCGLYDAFCSIFSLRWSGSGAAMPIAMVRFQLFQLEQCRNWNTQF